MDNLLCVIAGVLTLLISLLRFLRKQRYTPVQGICIAQDRGFQPSEYPLDGKQCTYQYRYQGKTYTYRDINLLTRTKIQVGQSCQLYIHPRNPHKCVTPSYREMTFDLFLIGLGFFFLAWVL